MGIAAAVENLADGEPLDDAVKVALGSAIERLKPLANYGDDIRKPLGRLIKLAAAGAEPPQLYGYRMEDVVARARRGSERIC